MRINDHIVVQLIDAADAADAAAPAALSWSSSGRKRSAAVGSRVTPVLLETTIRVCAVMPGLSSSSGLATSTTMV